MITASYPLSNNLLRQICCIASDPTGAGNVPNFNMGHEIGAGNGGSVLFDWDGANWGQIAQSTSGYNSNTVLRIDSLIADSTPIWLTNGTSNTFTQTSNYVTANSNYPVNRFAMGGYSSTFVGSRNFYGTIYEILLYSKVLTTNERQQVEGYLAKKWGLSVPSRIQTPLSIPGCSVWFDGADTTTITGNPVTAWRDKSGNNWNATTLRGSAPGRISVNGSNAVSFSASSTLTVSNVTFSSVQSRAIFAVYRVLTSAPNYISWFSTQTTSNINNQGGHNNLVYPSGGGGPYLQSFAVGGATQGMGADPAVSTIGTTAIACMIHSAVSTANNVVTLNGISYPLTTNTLASGYGSGTVTYYIGNAYPQAYILCEYIMYQREFTVGERKQVEGYLANKWGVTLPGDLPDTHLFKSRPVALVVPPPIHPLITPRSNNCFIVKYNSNGAPIWARRIGGPDGSYVGYSVTRDSSENIIVTGTYTFLTEIYGANGKSVVFTLQTPPGGSDNVFVVKYDSSGTPLWVRILGGTSTNIGNSISTDSSGNIIVVGNYTSTSLNIFAANGSTVSFSLTNSGLTDSFVVKYDSNGTPLWARRIGGTGNDQAYSVSTDSSGNIIVAGFCSNMSVFAADGTTVAFTVSGGNFIVKYDSSGTPLWTLRLAGASTSQQIFSVTTDSSQNIIVTGTYSVQIQICAINGSSVVFTLRLISTSNEAFVAKFNSSGTFLWANRMGGTGTSDIARSVCTDSSQNVIVTGNYNSNPLSFYY
jgi:hypothetical protein